MTNRPTILLQLDADSHASVFDSIVAIDAAVDHVLTYHQVEPADVQGIVHGAIFTRGGADLAKTAIFIGGSDVSRAELLLEHVLATFFGPMRVSVMMDANGANTTAAAAVVLAGRHLDLDGCHAAILAGTGPVGQRVGLLLARSGCRVRVASRHLLRANEVCEQIMARSPQGTPFPPQPVCVDTMDDTAAAIDGCQLVVSAGAAGIPLLRKKTRIAAKSLRVVIDLNAVPPLGVEETEATDNGTEHDGQLVYGAITVGGMKMKIHRESVGRLFDAPDQVLDAEAIFEIGKRQ